MKTPCHWPLCGEFTGDRWIPRTNGQLRRKCFHLMTSSCVSPQVCGNMYVVYKLSGGKEHIIKFEIESESCTSLIIGTRFRPVSQMRALLAAYRELADDYAFPNCYMFLDIKRNTFLSMLRIPALWYFDTPVTYPNDFAEWNLLLYPTFCIAAIFVKYCYTASSWLL